MGAMDRLIGGAVFGALGLLVVLLVATSLSPSYGPSRPLLATAEDGREPTQEPLLLSALDGEVMVRAFTSEGLPVVVFKVSVEALEATAQASGHNTGQYALRHPHEPDMAVLAYGAKSTHLGCTVGLAPGDDHLLPSALPGLDRTLGLLDPCHQGQWDVLAGAANRPGTVAPRPLDVVPLAFGPGADPPILHGAPLKQDRPLSAYEKGPLALAG